MERKAFLTGNDLTGEQKLVRAFLAISVAAHLLFFLVDRLQLRHISPPIIDDFGMETELLTDVNLDAAKSTHIPDVAKAPEAAVPKNLLPQLPKNFTVESTTPSSDKSLENPDLKAAEKIEEKVDPKAEAPMAEDKKKADEKAILETKPEKDNTLAQKDALKRLSIELLRQQQKKDVSKVQAPDSNSAAQVRTTDDPNAKGNMASIGIGSLASMRGYVAILKRAIKRNYNLPTTFKASGGNLAATVAIAVTAEGELASASVTESSGDAMFDDLVVQATKNSSPFPKPPAELADRTISVRFTP